MRTALFAAVLTACATPPPAPLANAGAAAGNAPAPLDLAWHFQGSARYEDDAVKLDYCCVAWGTAERSFPLAPGAWKIELAHANTDCTSAAAALVFDGTGMLLAHIPLAADRHGGVATEAFTLDPDGGSPHLVIGEIGAGLDCCGTTAVSAIRLLPQ